MHGSTPLLGHVEVHDLHHRYASGPGADGDVLNDITLSIPAGHSLALLGPSGCGKTTLLRSIAGLERPHRGTISIDGEEMVGAAKWTPPERRRVGMVFQDWALFPHLSVARNVAYGLGRENRRQRVAASLELVGLAGLEERMPSTLSGGQQQRVALARALAPRPRILLLDEPFSNLDTNLRTEVRAEVRQLLLQVGITAVFVTHDQEEAFVLGDQVAVMHDGRIIQIDAPQRLYTKPANRWVAEFIGEASLMRGDGRGATADTPLGSLPLEEDHTGPLEVLLRPEQLTLGVGDDATVELVEFYGHDAMVYVSVAGQQVKVRTGADPNVQRGDRCRIGFIGRSVRSFPAPQ